MSIIPILIEALFKWVKYIALVFLLGYIILATFNHSMRYIVGIMPTQSITHYNAITPLQDTYYVWDIVTYESDAWNLVWMWKIWDDYFYCNSDTIEWEELTARELYTSAAFSSRWDVLWDWAFGKNKYRKWFKLESPWVNCYIISEQRVFPYWIMKEYTKQSWPFNIVEREVLYPN